MRSFEAIDAELSAFTVRESSLARALEGVRALRGRPLSEIDAMLSSLGAGVSFVAASAPRDADALFEGVGGSRHSMLAPLGDEPMPVMADMSPSAAGDLAGLLEGSNSLMPPSSEASEVPLPSASLAVPISVAMPIEDEYEEMRAELSMLDDDDSLLTEIEIIDE